VIVQDPRNSGAGAIIAEQIPNCHVINKASTEKNIIDAPVAMAASQSAEEALQTIVSTRGWSEPQIDLVRAVARGDDILKHLGI
jgi:hypothetical protein